MFGLHLVLWYSSSVGLILIAMMALPMYQMSAAQSEHMSITCRSLRVNIEVGMLATAIAEIVRDKSQKLTTTYLLPVFRVQSSWLWYGRFRLFVNFTFIDNVKCTVRETDEHSFGLQIPGYLYVKDISKVESCHINKVPSSAGYVSPNSL
jgi:hypothetical protein